MTPQEQAAQQAMSDWLAHPRELGRKPAKLEPAGTFTHCSMKYYIFKYKKSLLSRQWLLGVCGGYEGDGTEHCGHVFSEMEPYDEHTARDKAVEMVEMVRRHWMERAAEEVQKKSLAGPFAGFILLSTPEWDVEQFKAALKADWGISYPEENGKEAAANDGHTALVFDVDGMTVAASLMEFPVPDGEAEDFANSNFFAREQAVAAAKAHTAQIMLAVVDREHPPMDRGKLYVKAAAACLKAPNALGIYANGTVLLPDYFLQAAEALRLEEIPLLDLVFVGLTRSEKGVCGYTNGLRSFGKEEVEIVDSKRPPKDVHALLLNIAGYVVEGGVTLSGGETLGYTAEQKLSITLSEGLNVDGMSLKIEY